MDGAEKRGALRPAATEIGADALERACFGFHRMQPARSAKRVLFWTQILFSAVLGVLLYFAIREETALSAQIGLGVLYTLFAATTAWRLYAAAQLDPVLSRIGEPKGGQWPTYTVLCPLYREANVVSDLVAALDRLNYPGMA